MKTKKEVLEYYGQCCVSEYLLTQPTYYSADEKGKAMALKDASKLENIRGQKKAIEFVFG